LDILLCDHVDRDAELLFLDLELFEIRNFDYATTFLLIELDNLEVGRIEFVQVNAEVLLALQMERGFFAAPIRFNLRIDIVDSHFYLEQFFEHLCKEVPKLVE